jgi:DNA-binding MarR family transcriptional regulator
MEQMRLKPPILKQRANSVIVFIRHESIASYETLVMSYLAEHGVITSANVRRICHVELHKGYRILKRLQETNILERVPGASGSKTAYRKTSGGRKVLTIRESDRLHSREREKKLIEYLERHDQITSPTLKELFQVPEVTAHGILKKLRAKGLIERLAGPRNKVFVYRSKIYRHSNPS